MELGAHPGYRRPGVRTPPHSEVATRTSNIGEEQGPDKATRITARLRQGKLSDNTAEHGGWTTLSGRDSMNCVPSLGLAASLTLIACTPIAENTNDGCERPIGYYTLA